MMVMNLEPDRFQRLIRDILTAHPGEIGCDECFAQLDTFVELRLAGRPAAEMMPLVQEHLLRCTNCREEYEALMAALQASI